jgi:hypothetical protein
MFAITLGDQRRNGDTEKLLQVRKFLQAYYEWTVRKRPNERRDQPGRGSLLTAFAMQGKAGRKSVQ